MATYASSRGAQQQQQPATTHSPEPAPSPFSSHASNSTLPRSASQSRPQQQGQSIYRSTGPAPFAAPTGSSSLADPGAELAQHQHQHQRINIVTYKSASIKALVDPTLSVSDVVRQLCANAHLGVSPSEPPALFALRDEDGEELVTDENLARKIEQGRNFK